MVRDNMKRLEMSSEKKVESEQLKDKIFGIQKKSLVAGERFEYGENQRIDDIEDKICKEKLKIKKVADEIGENFDDMLPNYYIFLSI